MSGQRGTASNGTRMDDVRQPSRPIACASASGRLVGCAPFLQIAPDLMRPFLHTPLDAFFFQPLSARRDSDSPTLLKFAKSNTEWCPRGLLMENWAFFSLAEMVRRPAEDEGDWASC